LQVNYLFSPSKTSKNSHNVGLYIFFQNGTKANTSVPVLTLVMLVTTASRQTVLNC